MKKLIHLSVLVVLVLQSFFPAIDAMAKEAGQAANARVEQGGLQQDATLTPTIEVTATAQDESAPELTPTLTDEATATPTETPAETAAPTETPLPPTPEASVTPIPGQAEGADMTAAQYQVLLEADPAFATPGGKITVSWNIPSVAEAVSAKLQLVFLFSAGMLPDPDEKQEGVFDHEKRTYTLPASAQGKFKLVIDEKAQAPLMIEAMLVENEQVIGTGLLDFPERTALNRQGGKVAAFNGNLKIRFPKDAVSSDAEVLVGRVKDPKIPMDGLVAAPFEVTVYTLPTGKAPQSLQSREVKKFKEPLVLEIAYDESAIRGDERDLQLFYWNTEVGSWFTVPSQVNTETNTLTGYSDHLTVFGMGIDDFQIAKPPTLEGFQVSEFTGAGAYSYPLDLPAGPGGLQPQLSLNYNSQVVDQATGSTQASWVGFGWSMDTPAIERNMHGTNFNTDDDTFSLSINGVGGMLLPGADGSYHTSEESFVRVLQCADGSCWSAWDKAGNAYYFGKVATFVELDYVNQTNVWRENRLAWRWSLSWVENVHGQRLTYDYFDQIDYVMNWECGGPNANQNCHPVYYDTNQAVYPSVITYPGGRTQVVFEYSDAGERKDYDVSWAGTNVFHQRYFLKSISVKRDTSQTADGVFETTIRKYDFAYETDPAKAVLPSILWNNGTNYAHNLTLTSITEKGLNAAQALPATTFAYGDKMHLTDANNGYGGKVVFTYEEQPWYARETSKSRTLEHVYGTGGNYCNGWPDSTGGWAALGGSTGFGCMATGLSMGTAGGYGDLAGLSPRYLPWERPLIKPGSYFRLTSNIFAHTTGTTAKLRISGGETGPERNIFNDHATLFDDVLYFPADSGYGYMVVETNGGAGLKDFTLRSLPSFYRVIKKEIYASQSGGVQERLIYSYESASMNTPGISAAAATAFPYIEAHSEFRGHEKVTVLNDLTGIKTVTIYCQSDDCAGKPLTIKTSDVSGKTFRETVYEYLPDPSPQSITSILTQIVPLLIGNPYWETATGLRIHWNRTQAVNSIVYAGGIIVGATREEYSYDSYGNQTQVLSRYQNGPVIDPDEWISRTRTEIKYLCADPDFPTACAGSYQETYNGYGLHLTSLPTKVKQFDAQGTDENADDTVLNTTLYLYDGNQGKYWLPVLPSSGKPGKLTAQRTATSPDGQYSQVSYEYDVWGNRSSEKAWSGYGTWQTPPGEGERTTTIEYDLVYNTYPIKSTDPLGLITRWTYNSQGLPESEIDPNSAKIEARYDSFGRMTQLVRPGDALDASPTIKIAYLDSGSSICGGAPFCVELSQRISGTQYYTLRRFYDGLGRQFKTQTGSTNAGSFSLYNTVDTIFDSATKTRQSVPYGPGQTPVYTTSESVFNAGKQISTVTAPDGSVTRKEIDGLTTTVTDPALHATISVTDLWGRTITVTPPEGPLVTYGYDLLDRLTSANRGGSITTIGYDMAGRKLSMNDPDMGNWTYQYDALGNLKIQTDARGCSLNMNYDPLSRLTHKYSSGGACVAQVDTTYTYDSALNGKGRRAGMTDASGSSSSWLYDLRGRVTKETKVIDANSFDTITAYNSADLPIRMTYPDGEVVSNAYTPQMMLETVNGTSNYAYNTYDAAGRIVSRSLGDHFVASSSQVTRASVAHDLLTAKYGNSYVPPAPTSQRFTDVPPTHVNYAWIDKFAADGISSGCGSGNYCPDSPVTRAQMAVFLLRVKHGSSYTPPAATGTMFADVPITHPQAAWIEQLANEHISNGCGGGNFCPAAAVTSAMEAALIRATLPRVAAQQYSYYGWSEQVNGAGQGGRLKTLTFADGSLQNLTYQYDEVGNISQITDALNGETQTYGYDDLDRLTDWTLNNALQERYTYSANGNLLSKGAPSQSQFSTEPSGQYTLQYDPDHPHAANKLVNSATGSVVNSYTQDANGNQTVRTIGGQTYNLAYDAENRLINVSKNAVIIAAFTYDGDGRQVKSVIDGVTTLYVGAHYEVRGSEITKYYFAGASRVAMRRYTIPVSMTVEYLLSDHLGSTSLTVDKNGVKTSAMRYTPWGEVRPETAYVKPNINTTPTYRVTNYTFTGQRSYMDDPTTNGVTEGFGLMFYNARWYDPQLGRFAQADTIIPEQTQGTQAWDRYAYVNNNPLKYTDPSGHNTCDEDGNCYDSRKGWSLAPGAFKWNYSNLSRRGYSHDEAVILADIYKNGGEDGQHAVDYMANNDVHIYVDTEMYPGIGAQWRDGDIYINAKQGSDVLSSLADVQQSQHYPWLAGLIAHEAKHLEQGSFTALTVYGEHEGWQVGYNVSVSMGAAPPVNNTPAYEIWKTPLSYNQYDLERIRIYMIQDQGWDYLIWLLPLGAQTAW